MDRDRAMDIVVDVGAILIALSCTAGMIYFWAGLMAAALTGSGLF
jgi:hypothetical protein